MLKLKQKETCKIAPDYSKDKSSRRTVGRGTTKLTTVFIELSRLGADWTEMCYAQKTILYVLADTNIKLCTAD